MIFVFIASTVFSQTSTFISFPVDEDFYPQDEQGIQNKKDKEKRDDFKVFGGVNFNKQSMENLILTPTMVVGWELGASYKWRRFFYWQIGATYNNSEYNLMDTTLIPDSLLNGVFSVSSVDIPVTVGLNFLTFVSRIVGLRVYVSAVPSFAFGFIQPSVFM